MIASLLTAGADPSVVGQIGQSALVEAVDTNDVEIVRLLLLFGADPARVQVGSMNILEYVRSSDGPSRAESEALLSASLDPD
jgi:ankyrin repeat protein